MICKQPDDYTSDYEMWNTVWHVFLNNGEEIWDDDKRPGLIDPSWVRLKRYCDENNLYITKMYLKFRSHYEHLNPNESGYFLVRKLKGHFGSDRNSHYFITGYLKDDGSVESTEWKCPELIPESYRNRKFETDKEFLINKDKNKNENY